MRLQSHSPQIMPPRILSLPRITVDSSVLHQPQLLANIPPPRFLGSFRFATVHSLSAGLEGL